MVAGNTYVDPVGLVGKTFALTWFFPLRASDGPLERTASLFVNNLALRRHVLERHPLPELPGTSRGACVVLARELVGANVPIYHCPGARAAHPAPHGFAHVSLRALAQGRDRLLRERSHGTPGEATWLASASRWIRNEGGSWWTIVTGFRRVGLHPLSIPAALAIAAYYDLLFWLGEMMLHLGIPAIRRVRI